MGAQDEINVVQDAEREPQEHINAVVERRVAARPLRTLC
jgi:hypothetical protein